MEDYCTWFFDTLFDLYIGDLCYDHDAAYLARDIKLKFKSDFILAASVWDRSYRSEYSLLIKTISIGMLAATLTVGTLFWIKTLLTQEPS